MNFLEVMACSKLQVSKIKYGYQIKKKSVYEHWYVGKPSKIIILGMFRILEYSKVWRHLGPCWT